METGKKLEVTEMLYAQSTSENNSLKKELSKAYSLLEQRNISIAGPLIAEIKVLKTLLSQLTGKGNLLE